MLTSRKHCGEAPSTWGVESLLRISEMENVECKCVVMREQEIVTWDGIMQRLARTGWLLCLLIHQDAVRIVHQVSGIAVHERLRSPTYSSLITILLHIRGLLLNF